MTFEAYMAKVDKAIGAIVGLSHDDLVDIDYWSNWDAEVPPDETAMEALEASGWH